MLGHRAAGRAQEDPLGGMFAMRELSVRAGMRECTFSVTNFFIVQEQ
jgi:hypothetical protein